MVEAAHVAGFLDPGPGCSPAQMPPSTEHYQVWLHPRAKWQSKKLDSLGYKQVNSQFPAQTSSSKLLNVPSHLNPIFSLLANCRDSLVHPASTSHGHPVHKCSPSAVAGMGWGHCWAQHPYTLSVCRVLRIRRPFLQLPPCSRLPTMMTALPD